MAEVNLTRLIGGNPLSLPYTLSKNGLGIKTSTLINTGANGYVFINLTFLYLLQQFILDVVTTPLPNPCNVRGFNGKQAIPITHYITLTLHIDGRKLKVPFLAVRLGDHDMILGRKWAAHMELLIDYKNRKLIWPENRPVARDFSRVIATTKARLQLNL